jgi:hypothetical protein
MLYSQKSKEQNSFGLSGNATSGVSGAASGKRIHFDMEPEVAI